MPDTESIFDHLRQKLIHVPTRSLALAFALPVATSALLVWAEAYSKWGLAQVCALALLLSVAFIGWFFVRPVDEKQLSDDARAYERVRHKVLIGVLIGYFALAINATRGDRWECGLVSKAFGYGTLIAGASLIAGVLLGFLFGFRPVGDRQKSTKQSGEDRVHPYTNLEEVADWLTKLIIGASLVEVRQISHRLGQFAEYVACGLYPIARDCKYNEQPSAPVSLAVMSFFFLSGVLYGYLWTRFEFALESHKDHPNNSDTGAAQTGVASTQDSSIAPGA